MGIGHRVGLSFFSDFSHLTVGVTQFLLSSWRGELSISPEAWHTKKFVRPTRPTLLCASTNTIILVKLLRIITNRDFLTWRAQPLRNIWAKMCNSYRGMTKVRGVQPFRTSVPFLVTTYLGLELSCLQNGSAVQKGRMKWKWRNASEKCMHSRCTCYPRVLREA